MKKIKSFFCCLFLMSPFLFSACATNTNQQAKALYATNLKKDEKNKHKKNIPPRLIQVIQGPERLRVILYSDVCFQFDGQLTAQCANQLSNTMKTIKRYGDGLIQVVGYTDDIYASQTAEKLSQRQADTVVAFLWSKGIGSQRLRAVGFAAHNSIASNRSVDASAANRRVEITLVR